MNVKLAEKGEGRVQMITEKFAAKEARRLFCLPFAPTLGEAQRLVLKEHSLVLTEHAMTEAHCAAVVDWLVKHSPRFPPPAEVLQACQSVEKPDKAKAPLGCDQCHGSGYIEFDARVRTAAGDYYATFARPCGCALGEFIRPEYEKQRNKAPGATQDLG